MKQIYWFIFFSAISVVAHAKEDNSQSFCQKYKCEFYDDWNAYYSDVGLFLNFSGEDAPILENVSELDIYKYLFSLTLKPKLFAVEASVNPMPVAGVLVKKHLEDLYNSLKIGEDFNLVKSVTAGFDEPYALSLFLGNMARFTNEQDQEKKEANSGYMGVLLSVGTQHIWDNELVDDNWYELEWKIKGDRNIKDETLSWSFRFGVKLHDNQFISDIAYIGLRRKHIHYQRSFLSWLDNVEYIFEYQFANSALKPVEISLSIDKKIPLKKAGFSLSLGLGVLHYSSQKYSGSLKMNDETIFLIRPSLDF